jgi:PAS domain S-box-containing protein
VRSQGGRLKDPRTIGEKLDGVGDLKTLLEGLIEQSPVAFQVFSADGRSLFYNPALARMFGKGPPPEYNILDDQVLERHGHAALIRRAFAGETVSMPPSRYDPRGLEGLDTTGTKGAGIQASLFPLRDASGAVSHVVVCASDVTSELDLADREERLRLAFDTARIVAWDTNLTNGTVHVSDNAACILGLRPDTPLTTLADALALVHPDDRAMVAGAATDQAEVGEHHHQFRVLRPVDGEVAWVWRRGRTARDPVTGDLWRRGIVMDVTERVKADEALRSSEDSLRRTEAQLRQAQKLEAIGRLAGGVAHDFNNLLSVVLSYSQLLLDDLPLDDRSRPDLEAIRRAGRQAAELTRQLLAFSRQQVVAPRVIDLGEAARGADKMLRRLVGEDIELIVRAPGEPAPVRADAAQIDQVVMNLALNARDAMPQGGKLTIEVAPVEVDEAYAREHLGVSPGPHVQLAVSDTGVGMDEQTRSHVFEPFFTTKEKGKGTGLGLATVFGIVQQSGGTIWVDSAPGAGTRFKILFPRAVAAVDAALEITQPTSLRGTETVLLVEDQEEVRQVAREILSRLGYEVLEAPNGAEALQLCERHPRPIDLLLTDVVMPQMSGRELAERVAPGRPDMRVLFMSGYTEDAILQHGILDEGLAFLQKPLVPDRLARRVREVLDVPARSARR